MSKEFRPTAGRHARPIWRWLVLPVPGLAGLFALALLGLMSAAIFEGISPLGPVGRLWFHVDVTSLNAAQVVFERYLWPPLWQDILFPVLMLPAPALLLVLACVAGVGFRLCRP